MKILHKTKSNTLVQQPIIEAEVQEPIKARRGRKPKSVTPTNINNLLGRPALAIKALENDTAKGVFHRRSNRNK